MDVQVTHIQTLIHMKYVIIRKSGPLWRRRVERTTVKSLDELQAVLCASLPMESEEYKIIIKRIGAKADELLDLVEE